jgi:putative ABC transport system permease protein
MRRSRAATFVALLTLALAIGVTSAAFSLLYGILLAPLPFEDPGRVVYVWQSNLEQGIEENYVSAPNFEDLQKQSESFAALAAVETDNAILSGEENAERVPMARVSPGFFQLLGTSPTLGRTFSDDTEAGAIDANRVILSHGLWQRRFGGRRDVIGETLLVNEQPHVITGVMPPKLEFPDVEIWTPYTLYADDWQRKRGIVFLSVVGRLAEGTTLADAQSETAVISDRLAELHPETDEGLGFAIEPVRDEVVGSVRTRLVLLFTGAVLVLLIACANVANLLLVRAFGRRSEFAVRKALGASHGQIVRQLLLESSVLAAAGAILGLGLGWLLKDVLLGFSPPDLPRLDNVEFGGVVFLFTLLITAAITLIFGIAPAWQSFKQSVTENLKGTRAHSESASGRRGWLGSFAVMGQLTLVTALLICSGLLARSLIQMMGEDVGFDPSDVLTLRVSLPEVEYSEHPRRISLYRQLFEELEGVPGVSSVGAISNLPFNSWQRGTGYYLRNRDVEDQTADYRSVLGEYFESMGIELIQGQTFGPAHAARRDIAIVDEAFANQYWDGESAVGKQISVEDENGPWLTIIGVVRSVRHAGFTAEKPATIYVPYPQLPQRTLSLTVRTRIPPDQMIDSLRSRIWELDRDLPIYDIATMEDLLARSLARERFILLLFLMFAVLALALALIGVYGVMAYNVARRTQEIGVRLALGAQKSRVLLMVLQRSFLMAVFGVGLGLALGLSLARLMSSLLYRVQAVDPLVYLSALLVLVLMTLVASLVPALRASHVSPAISIREA